MTVGDIHWVELPSVGGREQAGRRPAVIVQDDAYGGSLPTTIVVPLSSAMAALRFPGTARVKATQVSGLRTDSVALVFQIRAIDRARIAERIGAIADEELLQIRTEYQKLCGI
jgi:mRNA interferase MazF